MKNLLLIALSFFTLNAMSQEHQNGERRAKAKKIAKEMSAEDMASLKSKKMTLHLDLSEAQQKQVYNLILGEAQHRKQKMTERKAKKENKKELSKDDYVKLQNERLDQQIAFKAKMKTILTEAQYEKFEKMKPKKRRKKGKRKERK